MNEKNCLYRLLPRKGQNKSTIGGGRLERQDPATLSKAYTADTEWRNRSQFVNGRTEVVAFLSNKWNKEINYKFRKELWAFSDNRIAVHFEYEYQDHEGQRYRAYGNENWEFNENGLMKTRYASINDHPISEKMRKL